MNAFRRVSRRRAGPSMIVVADLSLMIFALGSLMYRYTASGMSYVPEIAADQRTFWEQRASELCAPPGPALQHQPLSEDADEVTQLAYLREMIPRNHQVWDLYKSCQEPRMVTIDEDLLHFKVDKYDAFESNPEAGFKKIRDYVDQNVDTHNLIYVVGHTDDTFTDEYNYLLSYRRALRVVEEIQHHLANRGRHSGAHYTVSPVGMGESQLVEKQPGESTEAWRRRCRRIEIYFRSSRIPTGKG